MSEEEKKLPDIPDTKTILIDAAPYIKFQMSEDGFKRIFSFNHVIDAYCIWCQKTTSFIREEGVHESMYFQSKAETRLFQTGHVKIRCIHNRQHIMVFDFISCGEYIMKTGQFPSFGDIGKPELQKYAALLGREKYAELKRAVGLSSTDAKVGAFVYLRRILEHIVEEAWQQTIKDQGLPEDHLKNAMMKEKLDFVAPHLPEEIAHHNMLWSILSKGVHQLSEKECGESFHALLIGIEVILDEKLHQLAREEKRRRAQKAINDVNSKLAKGS